MKKIILVILLCLSNLIFAENLKKNGDDILGLWITEKSKSGNQLIIEIYKTENNKFNGKIKDMTISKYTEGELIGQEIKDLKNPDKNLRSRKVVGIDFVYSYDYNAEKEKYKNGFIYIPWIGKEFYSYMKSNKNGTLTVKGTIDKTGLFGKKQIWKRLKK